MLSSVPEPCACTYSVNQHRCFASDFTHFIKLINQLVKIKLFRIEYRISNSMQTSLIQAQIHNSVCLTFILFIYFFYKWLMVQEVRCGTTSPRTPRTSICYICIGSVSQGSGSFKLKKYNQIVGTL